MVAMLGEVTGELSLARLHRQMLEDPVGRELLIAKPVISSDSIGLPRLRNLPAGTFGFHYARFLDEYGLSPDNREPVRFVDDPELAYVMLRYRQVHDFWHVLSGLPSVSVASEVALKWLEMVQTGLPVCALSAFVGPLRLSSAERTQLWTAYVPWALSAGRRSRNLMCVAYERHFDDDMDQLRLELNFQPFSETTPSV